MFKVIVREKGEDAAFLAIAAMQQGKVVDLDADLAIEAAAVGNDEKLAFADSLFIRSRRNIMRRSGHKTDTLPRSPEFNTSKRKNPEPNQALQRMNCTVTDCAPRSTLRSSAVHR